MLKLFGEQFLGLLRSGAEVVVLGVDWLCVDGLCGAVAEGHADMIIAEACDLDDLRVAEVTVNGGQEYGGCDE